MWTDARTGSLTWRATPQETEQLADQRWDHQAVPSGNPSRGRQRHPGKYRRPPENWSLYYPDPARAELRPAYDIVASCVYDHFEAMALAFRNTKNSRLIRPARFVMADRYVGMEEAVAVHELRQIVEAADIWPSMLTKLPMPNAFSRYLLERTARLALIREIGKPSD